MVDDVQLLAESAALARLLEYYVERTLPDRQAWHDRLMRQDDCQGRDLVRLHGRLIAHGWVEQNTGVFAAGGAAEVPGCYRATRGGIKALQRLRAGAPDD